MGAGSAMLNPPATGFAGSSVVASPRAVKSTAVNENVIPGVDSEKPPPKCFGLGQKLGRPQGCDRDCEMILLRGMWSFEFYCCNRCKYRKTDKEHTDACNARNGIAMQ